MAALTSKVDDLRGLAGSSTSIDAFGLWILKEQGKNGHDLKNAEKQEKEGLRKLADDAKANATDAKNLAGAVEAARRAEGGNATLYEAAYNKRVGASNDMLGKAKSLQEEADGYIDHIYSAIKERVKEAGKEAKRARKEAEHARENKQEVAAYDKMAKAREVAAAQAAAAKAKAEADAAAKQQAADEAAAKEQAEQEKAASAAAAQAAKDAKAQEIAAQDAAAQADIARAAAAKLRNAQEAANNATEAQRAGLEKRQAEEAAAQANAAQAKQWVEANQTAAADAAAAAAKATAAQKAGAAGLADKQKAAAEAAKAADAAAKTAPAPAAPAPTPAPQGWPFLAANPKSEAPQAMDVRPIVLVAGFIGLVSLAAGVRGQLRRQAPSMATFPNLG